MSYSNHYNNVKNWRHRVRRQIVLGFGGKCLVCGYNKCDSALEVHHLDPTEKDFTVASKIKSWDAIVQECKKCVLLCANCHREFHCGALTLSGVQSNFDETVCVPRRDEISKISEWKKQTKEDRRRDRQERLKKWDRLQEMVDSGMTNADIAKVVNVSWTSVMKMRKRRGI